MVPESQIRSRWIVAGVIALVVVLLVAAVLVYRWLGQRELTAGVAAYIAADCRTAMQAFHRVTTVYRLASGSGAALAETGMVECGLIVFADNRRAQGSYQEAVQGYEALVERFPQSILVGHGRVQAAAARLEWAEALLQTEDYAGAAAQVQVVQASYADTPSKRAAEVQGGAIYAGWAAALSSAGEYEEALEKSRILLAEYAGTPAAQGGAEQAAAILDAWASVLRSASEYAAAVEKYELILRDYPGASIATQVGDAIAVTRNQWAGRLRADDEFGDAISQYEAVLGDWLDSASAADAAQAIPETYLEWAAHERSTGLFSAALEKYRAVLARYPDSPPAAQVPALVVETHTEWAAALRADQRFDEAIQKYRFIVNQRPGTAQAIQATRAIGETYIEWGTWYHQQRQFIEALDRFVLAEQATEDAEVVVDAQTAYSTTLVALARDKGADGQQILQRALINACAGEPTDHAALGMLTDEPGRALFGGKEFALPGDLRAEMPGHFRYAICLEAGGTTVQRCSYTLVQSDESAYLVRQRRWWKVVLRDPRTGGIVGSRTFQGSTPDYCPWQYNFQIPRLRLLGVAHEEYLWGENPSSDEVAAWLREVVRQ